MLRLSDTSETDNFRVVKPSKGDGLIKIFVCGPTLYDDLHLGHARIFVIYDVLARTLKTCGYEVELVVNLTDINKNVFSKSIDQGICFEELSRYYFNRMFSEITKLNVTNVDRFAFTSDYVGYMKQLIKKLVLNGYAYEANGDVYFDTSKVPDYGRLSGQSRVDLDLHRIDIAPNKKNQEDFMLWNYSQDFGYCWNSEFGMGIPWWHIQDTAVALENLSNEGYDIHGGATELVYPHHEAHLAQVKAITANTNPVQFWMYVNLVTVSSKKMSKSSGNITNSAFLLSKYSWKTLRLYILSVHYKDEFEHYENNISRFQQLSEKLTRAQNKVTSEDSYKNSACITELINSFYDALYDDLNTQRAIKILSKLCDDLLDHGGTIRPKEFADMNWVLGLN